MFRVFKRTFGIITVEEKDGRIIVEGVPGHFMEKDLQQVWRTSKIGAHMFTSIDRSSFVIPSFFALDLRYILEHLLSLQTRLNISRRTARQIVDGLNNNTWLKNTADETMSCLNFANLSRLHWKPLDYQMKFLDYYNRLVPQFGMNGLILAAAAGSGKAQPLDSFIKVPGGWDKMGNMKVGSIVTAKDGTPSKVLGVFPQGKKEIFKLTFADGRSAEACADHLWRITRQSRTNQHMVEIVTTAKIQEYLNGWLGKRIYIDLVDSEISEDVELPIDPYIFGALLGDGCFRHRGLSITNPEQFIIDEISKALPSGIALTKRTTTDLCDSYGFVSTDTVENPFKNTLRELELFNKLSSEKHIPEKYLMASTRQRLALLQGLMDTDGTADDKGTCSFSTTSPELAESVTYLVRSLGGIAKLSLKKPSYTYNGIKKSGKLAYQINIRYKKPSDLFRLPKKKERAKDDGQYCEHLKLRIDSIQSIGFKEAQCISIDNPEHLYVTDGFVVTHNTFTSIALAECLESDHVIVVSPQRALHIVWEKTILEVFKTPVTYWMSDSGKKYAGQKYAIVHYEFLEKFLLECSACRGKVTIILDESHNLNEITSQRTQYFIELCSKVQSKNVVWASGTSIKAIGAESIPIFKTIDSRFTDEIATAFKKMFGKDAKKTIDILTHRIDLMSFKVEKSEMKLDKPITSNIGVKVPNGNDYTLDSIKVEISNFVEERKKYYASRRKQDEISYNECIEIFKKSLKTNDWVEFDTYQRYVKILVTSGTRDKADEIVFTNKYENSKILPILPDTHKKLFKEVKTIVKYTALKIQGECLGRILGKKRMECVRTVSEHFDYAKYIESTEKKTLIFTSYIEVLEKAKDVLLQKGFSPMVVYGKTNSELNSIIAAYESDKSINPLIATYSSLSTAVPLTVADVVIMLNTPFRDYIYQQAISRVHRLGANTQVYVYIAYLDTGNVPNLSTRSFDILKWSQTNVEKILGIENPFPVEDLGISLEDNKTVVTPAEHIDWIDPEEFAFDELADASLSLVSSKKGTFLSKW